jgi:hypothetical protein
MLYKRAMPMRARSSCKKQPARRGKERTRRKRQEPLPNETKVVALAGRQAERRAARKGPGPVKHCTAHSLWRAVLSDLHRLRQHRHPRGLLPPGQRDAWLFLAAVALAWTSPPEAMAREVQALASRFAGWSEKEVQSCISSVRSRAEGQAKGEVGTFDGKQVDLRYRYKAHSMIGLLQITPEEMRGAGLRVLVNEDVAREHDKDRKRDARRQQGMREQAAYLAQLQAKAGDRDAEILLLRERLGSVGAVATHLGITTDVAKKRLQRARKRLQSPSEDRAGNKRGQDVSG